MGGDAVVAVLSRPTGQSLEVLSRSTSHSLEKWVGGDAAGADDDLVSPHLSVSREAGGR